MALGTNYRKVRELISRRSPGTRMIAVVKADAYGHGAPACVKALLEQGCDFFAVASLTEALVVHRVCAENKRQVSILILGYTHPSYAKELATLNLIQSLLSADYARELQNAAKESGVTIRAHIAVDSGMNRIGFPIHGDGEIAQAAEKIACVCRYPNLSVEGMFSHFAAADFPKGSAGADFTGTQFQRYEALKQRLKTEHAVQIPFHHFANSAASLLGRDAWLMNGARVGILLYGVDPCGACEELSLSPVMKLKTRIVHIHDLPTGEPLGYGCTFTADTPRLIATLSVGYADGFLRKYQGATVTFYHDGIAYSASVVGRICMDQCMIDVTGLPAAVGDEVVLFGNSPEELSRLSASAATIDYETLCLISSRVPRIYPDAEKQAF